MRFGYIDREHQDEWEALVKGNPASGYMQSFAWSEFKQLLGWDTFKIGMYEHDDLVGGAVVSKFSYTPCRNALFISEGPVLPYTKPQQCAALFHSLMKEIDSVANLAGATLTSHLSVEPKLTQLPLFFDRFHKAPIDQLPLRTLHIDLTQSEQSLWNGMHQKCRYNIHLAEKHGVTVTNVSLKQGWRSFYSLYKDFTERKKFEGKDKQYFNCLSYCYPTLENAHVYLAHYRGSLLDAAIVLSFGDTATFLYGASSALNRKHMSSYLLHWQIMKDVRAQGYHWYDLYGLTPIEGDVSHPWYGFSEFKQKFGGSVIQYTGAYDFIYNQQLYEEYLHDSCGN
jgi:lipid II:glycine glycyltransferase (peptidoglycan interpeptide bridge formation enzyme)